MIRFITDEVFKRTGINIIYDRRKKRKLTGIFIVLPLFFSKYEEDYQMDYGQISFDGFLMLHVGFSLWPRRKNNFVFRWIPSGQHGENS